MTIAPARRMTLAMFFALPMFAISLSLLAALVLVNAGPFQYPLGENTARGKSHAAAARNAERTNRANKRN